MIPLGATVRWARTIEHRKEWKVTGHPQPGYVELDGHGAVNETSLEVVEASRDDENAGLAAVVAQQCELIGELQEELAACPDADEIEALHEAKENASALKDAVSDALLALTGTRRPSQRDCAWPEIWALAEAAEYFED